MTGIRSLSREGKGSGPSLSFNFTPSCCGGSYRHSKNHRPSRSSIRPTRRLALSPKRGSWRFCPPPQVPSKRGSSILQKRRKRETVSPQKSLGKKTSTHPILLHLPSRPTIQRINKPPADIFNFAFMHGEIFLVLFSDEYS